MKTYSKEEIEKLKDKTNKKWDKILKNLDKSGSIEYSMEVIEVEKTAVEDVETIHKAIESSYDEVALDTGLILGVLIKILRNK